MLTELEKAEAKKWSDNVRFIDYRGRAYLSTGNKKEGP